MGSLQFVLDQHRGSLDPLAVLQRKQRQDMRRSGFQFRDQLLGSSPEKSIENNPRNTDSKPGGRVNQRLTNPSGKTTKRPGPKSAPKWAEEMKNPKTRPK